MERATHTRPLAAAGLATGGGERPLLKKPIPARRAQLPSSSMFDVWRSIHAWHAASPSRGITPHNGRVHLTSPPRIALNRLRSWLVFRLQTGGRNRSGTVAQGCLRPWSAVREQHESLGGARRAGSRRRGVVACSPLLDSMLFRRGRDADRSHTLSRPAARCRRRHVPGPVAAGFPLLPFGVARPSGAYCWARVPAITLALAEAEGPATSRWAL